ncbi:MAG: preprotein translocase subunit SecA [Flavobacteriales bacterium]|nr:preprotein translocase subunit SecA [Flavobacteriales bacterium]
MLEIVNKVLNTVFGNKSEKDIRELTPRVQEINNFFESYSTLTNDELRARTADFRTRIALATKDVQDQIDSLKAQVEDPQLDYLKKEDLYSQIDKLNKILTEQLEVVLGDLLPEAFAVVKETARRFKENTELSVTAEEYDREISSRHKHVIVQGDTAVWKNTWEAAGIDITWDMLHYDVQLIGGMVLHNGNIAEMATGEGKTLVATLPVYLNALTGRGVHIVTVNDYLARRDSEWMAPMFEFHGLSVECIDKHRPNSEERRNAYQSDIIYGTNNEFGFDYLRDNMSGRTKDLVQREHNYTIVDEVDSVLIDDARTPLIISGPTPKGDEQQFEGLKPRVEKLVGAQRKLVNELLAEAKKLLALDPEEVGDKKVYESQVKLGGEQLLRCYRGLPKNKALIKFLSEPGVRTTLQKTENYYMQDQMKEMHKIDDQLFFTIEEQHNSIELCEKGIDLITDQGDDSSFFILPDIGSELSDLENRIPDIEERSQVKDKLITDYAEKAERIHAVNQLLKAYALFEKEVEYVVMDGKVKIVDEQTGRVMEGRRYSDGLHQAIETKENVKVEAATQTYATVTLQNYFRMYNKLSGMTGTAETEAGEFWEIYKLDVVVIPTNKPITRDDQEDLVFKTAREKYNAVIEEVERLRNAGRPILVGTTTVEISELLSRMLKMKKIPHQVLNAKLHQSEAEVVAAAGKPGTVTIATNMAGRGTDIKLGPGVKEAGGLAIVGTERHESRRVDRQLRGRAGRQGDPGSSQFFVSLEDGLMRIFGSERIAKLMDRMGLKEGEVIQHSMVSKSIERAQKKVEENNFGIRKNLLEYDDVMNMQREVIYKRRRHALFGERMTVETSTAIHSVCVALVNEHQEARDYESFELDLFRTLTIQSPVSEEEFLQRGPDELADVVFSKALSHYQDKNKYIAQVALPVIQRVHSTQGDQFKNIEIPLTDGSKALPVVVDMEAALAVQGKNIQLELEKSVTLAMIDLQWKEHLREMDDLRQSVRNAQYEQKDPLLIYKFESYNLFEKLLEKVNRDIVSFLFRANLPNQEASQAHATQGVQADSSLDRVTATKQEVAPGQAPDPRVGNNSGQSEMKREPVRVDKKPGRNDRVEIRDIQSGETKVVKFKLAEQKVEQGQWEILQLMEE